MKIEIVAQNENRLLKRKEVHFRLDHSQTGSTPTRLEVRKDLARTLKTKADLVFIRKVETKTGTHMAIGLANIYDSLDHARLAEPKHFIKRNMPSEKPAEKQEGKT